MNRQQTLDLHTENIKYLKLLAAGDVSATDKLMELNQGLVTGLAYRFRGRGTDFEDLVQIGSIGMLKAIRSFDLSRGTAFSTYAVPLIIGEIRKYLRDDGPVKVSRTQKRLGAQLLRERENYIREHGREPRIDELAEACDVSSAEAAAALESAAPVHSLSEIIAGDDMPLESIIPSNDDTLGKTVEYIALSETIRTLSPLWRQIITLRYFKDYSQQQTADALGLSQVKVSREEKKIFERLRRELG